MTDEATVILFILLLVGVPTAVATYFRRNPKAHDAFDRIGTKLVGWTILGAATLWVGFTFLYAPASRKTEWSFDKPPRGVDNERRAMAGAEVIALIGDESAKLVLLQGDNLDVYVRRPVFEVVPFPNREAFVTSVGARWCKAVNHTFFPTVTLKDIRTGQELASYGCVGERTSLANLNGWFR
jgi:hypothetical protein